MERQIIVVGSGISGTVCAYELKRRGYDVILLEAKVQPGGRTASFSFNIDGQPISFNAGAAWIHRGKENPIWQYVNDFQVKTVENNGQVGFVEKMYLASGTLLNENDVQQTEKVLKQIQQHFAVKARSLQCDKPISELVEEILQEHPEIRATLENNERVRTTTYWLFDEYGQYEATTLNNLSSINNDFEFGRDDKNLSNYGIDHTVITYANLIEKMLATLPAGSVYFNDPVTDIHYGTKNEKHAVTVRTRANKIYKAEKVVITASLGVLKAGKINFNPPLPQRKLDSIAKCGFGALEKITLHFEQAFWDSSINAFAMLDCPISYWANMVPVYHLPVIVGFFAPPFSYKINDEKWSDEQVVAYALSLFKQYYNIPTLPKLLNSHVTRWTADPWTLGSYSYKSFRATMQDIEIISEPVENQLFFAGEHTSLEANSYAHGAVLSGLRECNRIHQSYPARASL